MPQIIENKNAYKLIPIILFFVLFVIQVMPLFWVQSFYIDWLNHVWLTQYFSDYFIQNINFPEAIDVSDGVGNFLPIFYGTFFYPIAGIIGAIVNGDIAIRFICLILLFAPLVSYVMLFYRQTGNLQISILASIIVNSSIYQLTNLYARSALTEFIAYQLLLISISLIFIGLGKSSRVSGPALSLGFCLMTLSLGTHPITFYSFVIFVGPLFFFGMYFIRNYINFAYLRYVPIWLSLVALLLTPWIRGVLEYRDYLKIARAGANNHGGLVYFPDSIDSLLGRIGFFYVDSRLDNSQLHEVSTPFLDAPIQICLLFLVFITFFFLLKNNRKIFHGIFIPWLALFFLLILVLVPQLHFVEAIGRLGKIFSPVQFGYRLTGTLSVFLIATFAICIFLVRLRKAVIPSLYFLALLAISLNMHKLYLTYYEFVKYPSSSSLINLHAKSFLMDRVEYQKFFTDTKRYPPHFYGALDYTMPDSLPRYDKSLENLIPLNFTSSQESRNIHCSSECDVVTNILPSKIIKIYIDGFSADNALQVLDSGYLSLRLNPGAHEILITRSSKSFFGRNAMIWFAILWLFLSTAWMVWVNFQIKLKH